MKVIKAIVGGIAYLLASAVIGISLASAFFSEAECNAARDAVIRWAKASF